MIKINDKTHCCGCSVCFDACPQNCISMATDEEGFMYPEIDSKSCINCGICDRVCPMDSSQTEKAQITKAYAAWNKNPDIRIESTSGGVFTALAEAVIRRGGVIVGAEYTADNSVAHVVADTNAEILRLRQSKYVQSDTKGIYGLTKEALKSGKLVMFCGTPCHTEALVKYLKGKPDNLILCDFICRGIISPEVYREYLKYLEKKYRSKITKVHFKNKTFGWHRFSTKISFENGKEYLKDRYHDSYMLLYLRENITLRPSCYDCRFKGLDRCSDITLGDFWRNDDRYSEYDNDQGTSAVIVNSEVGHQLLFSATEDLVIHPVEVGSVIAGNPCIMESPVCNRDRSKFYNELKLQGYAFIKRKYCGTFSADLKKRIKIILRSVKG